MMTKAVYKLCYGQVSYRCNTTNKIAYLTCHHPELNPEQVRRAPASQQTLGWDTEKTPNQWWNIGSSET